MNGSFAFITVQPVFHSLLPSFPCGKRGRPSSLVSAVCDSARRKRHDMLAPRAKCRRPLRVIRGDGDGMLLDMNTDGRLKEGNSRWQPFPESP
jgi:hypothetical protein